MRKIKLHKWSLNYLLNKSIKPTKMPLKIKETKAKIILKYPKYSRFPLIPNISNII